MKLIILGTKLCGIFKYRSMTIRGGSGQHSQVIKVELSRFDLLKS